MKNAAVTNTTVLAEHLFPTSQVNLTPVRNNFSLTNNDNAQDINDNRSTVNNAPGYYRRVWRCHGETGAFSRDAASSAVPCLSHSALERDSSLFSWLCASGRIIRAYVTSLARPSQIDSLAVSCLHWSSRLSRGLAPCLLVNFRAQQKCPGSIDRLLARAAAATVDTGAIQNTRSSPLTYLSLTPPPPPPPPDYVKAGCRSMASSVTVLIGHVYKQVEC